MKNSKWSSQMLENIPNLLNMSSELNNYNQVELEEALKDVYKKIKELKATLTGNVQEDLENRKKISDLELFQELLQQEKDIISFSQDLFDKYTRNADPENEKQWLLNNTNNFLTEEQNQKISELNESEQISIIVNTIKNNAKRIAEYVNNDTAITISPEEMIDSLRKNNGILGQYISDSLENLNYYASKEELIKSLNVIENACEDFLWHYNLNEKNNELPIDIEVLKEQAEEKTELDILLDSPLLQRKINSMDMKTNQHYVSLIDQRMTEIIQEVKKVMGENYEEQMQLDSYRPNNYVLTLQEEMISLKAVRNQLLENQRALNRDDLVSKNTNTKHERQDILGLEDFKHILIMSMKKEHKDFIKNEIGKDINKISISELVDKLDEKFGIAFVNNVIEMAKELQTFKELGLIDKNTNDLANGYDEMQKHIHQLVSDIEKNGLPYHSKEAQELKEYLEKLQISNSMTADFIKAINNFYGRGKITDLNSLIRSADMTMNRFYNMREHFEISGMEKDAERELRLAREQLRRDKLTYKYNQYYADNKIAKEKEAKRITKHAIYKVKSNVPKIRNSIFRKAGDIYQNYYNTSPTPEKKNIFQKIKDRIGSVIDKFKVTDKPTEKIADRAKLVENRGLNVTEEDLKQYKKEPAKEEPIIRKNKEEKVTDYSLMMQGCSDLSLMTHMLHADISKTEVDYKHDEIVLHGYKGEILRFNHETNEIVKNTFPNEIDGKEINYKEMVESITDRQIKGEMKHNEYRRNEGKEIINQIRKMDIENEKDMETIENSIIKSLGLKQATVVLDTENKTFIAYQIDENGIPSNIYSASLKNGTDINVMIKNENGELEFGIVNNLVAETIMSALREKVNGEIDSLDKDIEAQREGTSGQIIETEEIEL